MCIRDRPVLIYRPFKDGWLSKPRPRVQRATDPRLLHDHPRPSGSNRGSSDPKSSTRLSCQPKYLYSKLESKTCETVVTAFCEAFESNREQRHSVSTVVISDVEGSSLNSFNLIGLAFTK